MSAFFALPVKRADGTHLSHEQVINLLDDETVSYQCDLGVSGAFGELLRVTLKVEKARYEAAVVWLKDLMYGGEFVAERYVNYGYVMRKSYLQALFQDTSQCC